MSTLPQEYQDSEFESYVIETREYAGELTIEVKAEAILAACQILKSKFGFNYLADITGIDYYTDNKRFGVSYNLVNMGEGKRIRVTARVEESKPELHSVTTVWTAANWFEREVLDMVGIHFRGNHDMRRIFMPEDFEYYPLRKEFPLIGIPGSIQMPEKDPPKPYK
ncbi:MAG: NADH-quinone oxidoreductase subunit C [Bacteroidia bacterium]|nr:NADH-quinone oxidoreductase subunit C [Bacteroidia bacterium]